MSDERQRCPFAVVRDDESRGLAAEDRAGAEIGRLRTVAVLDPVLDLKLIAGVRSLFAGQAAEEDATVQRVAVGFDLGLQDEVIP